jgi:hypothetical protein
MQGLCMSVASVALTHFDDGPVQARPESDARHTFFSKFVDPIGPCRKRSCCGPRQGVFIKAGKWLAAWVIQCAPGHITMAIDRYAGLVSTS